MNLLTVGGFSLTEALQRLGHRVVQAETFLAPGAVEVDLEAVLDRLPAADRPDLLLVVERLGTRRLPLHLEKIKIPRAFYALDPHLNLYWHQKYASAFDLIFSTQKTSLSAFRGERRPVYWLPWAVNRNVIYDHNLPRPYEVAFVGRVDSRLRLKRHLILDALKNRFSLHHRGDRPENQVTQHELGRIYSQARVVINESIQGEVNLRVFEALAAGALLLTEDVGPNLLGLFTPGEHLVTYGPEDLVEKAAYYLAHEAKRRAIARQGRDLVYARHDTPARARQFLDYLGEGDRHWHAPDHLQLGQTMFHLTIRGLYPARLGAARAQFHLQEAKSQHPGKASTYLTLGQVALLNQDYAGAQAAYDLAQVLAPKDFHLQILRGHLFRHLSQPDAAAAAFRRGLNQARAVPYPLRREVWALLHRGMGAAPFFTGLGRIYEAQGLAMEPGYPPATDPCFFSYALEYYSRALELAPHYPPALKSLGQLLERHGFHCEAVSCFEKWTRAEPENPEARWLLGQAQLKGYQPREGLKNLLLAQILDPQRDLMNALRGAPLTPATLKTLLPQITPEELWSCQALPC